MRVWDHDGVSEYLCAQAAATRRKILTADVADVFTLKRSITLWTLVSVF